jgi:hypothetical protein
VAALSLCATAGATTHRSDGTAGGAGGSFGSVGTPDPLGQIALQQAELYGADGAANDDCGTAVAISGDTALVGAPGQSSGRGAVYVFTRSGGSWVQRAELTASDAAAWDQFGSSVALSGDTAVVGAPEHAGTFQGAAYVFTGSGSDWSQQAELTASDAADHDFFGDSVGVSGDTAIVGATGHVVDDDHRGAVYVFTRSGASWTQETELTPSGEATGVGFGNCAALSGDTAIVGASNFTVGGNDMQGAAYVFAGSGSDWSQQAELIAGDGAAEAMFGGAVSVDGDTALVGAQGTAAYVFTRSGSTWSQQAELTAADGGWGFGVGVAISGGAALVTSNSSQAGYVFVGSGASWSQQAEFAASDGAFGNNFGWSAALDGATTLIGSPYHTVGGHAQQGAAYVDLISPVNYTAPVVSGSTAPGETLACTTGGWAANPVPTFTYQWLRDGDPIADATAATYVLQDADCAHDVSCRVTAGDDAGSTDTTSNTLSIPGAAPANTVAPVVSGTTGLGDTLSCTAGTWTGVPTPTLTYQWLRDGVAITDATADSYDITADDQGHLLCCEVTATNILGTLAETSAVVAVPAPLGAPVNTAAPVVTGSATLGQTLSCSSGGWSGAIAGFTYQWLRGGVAIDGATASTYQLTVADCGTSVSCVVTAGNEAGDTSVESNRLSVAAAPVVSLRAQHKVVAVGRADRLSGTVAGFLPAGKVVCICRRVHGKLVVMKRVKLTASGTYKWSWASQRSGSWRFVATYAVAGHRFASATVGVTVRKK